MKSHSPLIVGLVRIGHAGGFNKRSTDFAFSKRNLKLIDGDELVQLIYKYYPKLDGKYKGMIPLRQVYIPETLTK